MSKDESGELTYHEDHEQEHEQICGYTCGDCGEYLKLHGEVVTDEAMLMEYMERYGVDIAQS